MPSPNDNIQIRDGLAALFKMRSKDTSGAQDGSLQTIRHLSTPYPVDYGVGGCFQASGLSGNIVAGLAAASPVYSFRWSSSTMNALIRRVSFAAWTGSAGFAAGVNLMQMFTARSFTASDTGGTAISFTGSNAKLRTAMGASAALISIANTGALTPGTRTLDAQSLELFATQAPTSANTMFPAEPVTIFDRRGASHPLLLAQNEGFVINATVPATGTWVIGVTTEWDEVPLVNY